MDPFPRVFQSDKPNGCAHKCGKGVELARHRQKVLGCGEGKNIFLPHEAKVVLSIPISGRLPKDSVMWAWTTNGIFTVKSAYKVA